MALAANPSRSPLPPLNSTGTETTPDYLPRPDEHRTSSDIHDDEPPAYTRTANVNNGEALLEFGPHPLPPELSSRGGEPSHDNGPTNVPTPGRPLLNNGRVLVYKPGFTCQKCELLGGVMAFSSIDQWSNQV